MGLTEHTPGPWTVAIESPTQITVAQRHGERNIVHIRWPGSPELAEQDSANARLIASAPDMLQVLRAFIEHGYCPNCGCDAWNTAGCPTCPIMRSGYDILVSLGERSPRHYAPYMEADEINKCNMGPRH